MALITQALYFESAGKEAINSFSFRATKQSIKDSDKGIARQIYKAIHSPKLQGGEKNLRLDEDSITITCISALFGGSCNRRG